MRLLVVTNDYPPKPGGIQQWIGSVLDAFPGDVLVLAPTDSPADNARGEAVVRRRRGRFLWPTRGVRRWVVDAVTNFAPDIVFYVAPHPLAFMAEAVRKATGVPYAVMTHGAEIDVGAAIPFYRTRLRRSLRGADALLAVSEDTAHRVERLVGMRPTVVGAGVEVNAFAPGQKPASPVVGCVSRFVPRKGQAGVLRAVAALRKEGSDVSVLLVGRGRQEQRLRKLAAGLGVPTEFAVDVPWTELPDLYRRMSVFAMPCRSRWFGLEREGLGIVFLEAAASGLAVVAGDSGGAPETVIEGVTGYVVGDDEALEDRLRTLLADDDSAVAMGVAGRQRVVDEFTWERVAGRITTAFEAIG